MTPRDLHSDPISDQELILAHKNGDENSLGVLYKRYAHLVLGVCLKYLRDREDAKDASADIFIQLMTKLRAHEVGNFKSWLYTLSKNHCLMEIRKSKRGPQELNGMQVIHAADDFSLRLKKEKESQLERLEEAISTLKDEQQICVRAFYLGQKSYVTIAQESGLSVKSVKSQIQNGKRNLKIILEKQHEFKQGT